MTGDRTEKMRSRSTSNRFSRTSQCAGRVAGPASHRPRRPRRRAVTLIELLIVISILALVIVVSIPTMKGTYRRNRLAGAGREFALAAKYARRQAILRNHTTELRIQRKKGLYYLSLDPGRKKTYRGSGASLEARPMERIRQLSEGTRDIRFESIVTAADSRREKSDVSKISFHRDGSASACTIVIADADDRRMTIEVLAATGAVRVYQGSPEEREAVYGPEEETDS